MADNSAIEWTDATWNPVTGCTKVSPGCDHCYAERITERFHGKDSFAVVRRDEEKVYLPLRWRKPRRIFVNSMSDLFHDDVPDGFVARVFATMARAQQHTFQVLTKRHGRMRAMLNAPSFEGLIRHTLGLAGDDMVWPLPNVWLGVSAENQQWADIRIPALLETPAAVRWVSAEPLLGPIVLADAWLHPNHASLASDPAVHCRDVLDWLVTGGESGPRARPADPNWFRSIRDQCVAAGVRYLHKQNGEWAPNGWRGIGLSATNGNELLVGPMLDDMGHREVIERVGKKRAGRELDGRTWDEYPDREESICTPTPNLPAEPPPARPSAALR